MLQRSRRLLAAVNLDYFSGIIMKSGKFHKLGVTLSATSPNDARDAKSSKTVSLSLLGFLGISSALFYWIRKKEIWWSSVNLPVAEAAFESDLNIPQV